jgi:penicillin-binding protein 2
LSEQHQPGQGGLVEYRTHYLWAVIVVTVLALVLVGRFFLVQIVRGEEYEKKARIDYLARERIPARRGVLFDRTGRVLAENVSEHSISVVPHYLERNTETLPRLRELLGLTDEQYGDIARRVQRGMTDKLRFNRLTVMRDVVSDRCPYDGAKLMPGESDPFLWCPACGDHYEVLGRDQARCAHDDNALDFGRGGRVGRCPACGATYVIDPVCPEDGAELQRRTARLGCAVCARGFDDQVAIVTANLHELPGLSLDAVLRRRYPERFLLAHLLGYMNEVNATDLQRNPGVYRRGDFLGRTGLERALEGDPQHPEEPNLRGTPGEEVYFRDGRGQRLRAYEMTGTVANLRSVPAEPGDDFWLTVDVGIQKLAERAMRAHPSGAVVVMEVHTGRILALYSKPSFDPNVWSGRLTQDAKREYDENLYAPLMDKSLTAFAPGSVYKVITALAALEEGIADPEMTIHCPGYYEFGGRRFRCHKRSGHGDMNLVQALYHSCDVYFYRVGELLGMDRLERYATEVFGLGQPTGVEVFERTGRVPSRAWHREHSPNGWMPGFTLSTAVGQGAVLTSPLQIARLYAALANGGRVLRAHVVLQAVGPDGQIRRRYMPEVERLLGLKPEHMAIVHEGLVQTVHNEQGTGREARVPGNWMHIAGKTGTAEAAQFKKGASEEFARWLKQDHAWFAAYAPAEDPQISIVVFLEHGGSGGKNAAPIARQILEQYFRRGFGTVPEAEATPTRATTPTEALDGID